MNSIHGEVWRVLSARNFASELLECIPLPALDGFLKSEVLQDPNPVIPLCKCD
jgi:hypothetical protein